MVKKKKKVTVSLKLVHMTVLCGSFHRVTLVGEDRKEGSMHEVGEKTRKVLLERNLFRGINGRSVYFGVFFL